MPETISCATVDGLAKEYIEKAAACDMAEQELKALRDIIIARVQEEGSYPPRATKTKVLAGEEFDLRVTEPTEISVDSKTAERIKAACLRAGAGRLFPKLFRKVESFVLAGGAEKLLNGNLPERAPRNLRSLFARAVRVKDLAPQLEVKKRKQQQEAA
ncbi:MAG TPA: hypothetical protein VKQ28_14665 [Candidatus Acidoferrum sp.]|nr:hypothetical protein [Candidatus Acidoferrum sp.]